MENASKALIIAGAILLSILIISLGIIVYNQAKGTVGNVNLSEHEIATFNQKFETYEGNNISGVSVNNLINAVITSNTAAIRDNTGSFVTIQFPTMSSNIANNYYTMGVDTAVAVPVVKYAGLAGAAASAAAVTLPNGAVENPAHALKVQSGKTYIVEMHKDGASGLIDKIRVTKRP